MWDRVDSRRGGIRELRESDLAADTREQIARPQLRSDVRECRAAARAR
ncbi:MAG: hypothetical protein M5U32_11015 [Myxococcota bacterium]|nr:hypothetical protein [Myxococcota bacterium]